MGGNLGYNNFVYAMATEKFILSTPNPAEERLKALRELFPEAFKEGRLDLETLKLLLGEEVEAGRERYGLSWAGKAEAIRAAQIPSSGTLRPKRDQSVDFDTTENVIIEGDNLEVLKLIQKAYHGKVKLIYIDPPYNTGNDFIYQDDFRQGLREYLRQTGRLSDEGIPLSTDKKGSGRFHSRWLTMMYPRLQLARSLLREDGAIFISIDDNEVHSLRMLMDEIFGEENFIATIIWQKVFAPKNSAEHFSVDHDYIVVYAKNADKWRPELLPRTEEANARYANPDNDPRGPWTPGDLTARNYYAEGQYEVVAPGGKVHRPSIGNYWRISKEKFDALDKDGRIWWGNDKNSMPRLKRFLSEVKQGMVPRTLWTYEEVGHTQEAKQELVALVPYQETDNVLDTVKPTRLLQRILQIATRAKENDLVLDFFAGSGTTGQAVLAQNAEDGGNRRFILVQFPEPLPKPEPMLKTIADVTRTRVRNAEIKLREQKNVPSSGFRAFSLDTSNFKSWDSEAEDIQGQLEGLVDNLVEGRSQEDVLFELLLKAGLPLSSRIEEKEIEGQKVYSVVEGQMLVCLERPIRAETLRAMMNLEPKPGQVVCLDVAFLGNDALKTNIVLEMRDRGIRFRTV